MLEKIQNIEPTKMGKALKSEMGALIWVLLLELLLPNLV
jgi:hypothetical protein